MFDPHELMKSEFLIQTDRTGIGIGHFQRIFRVGRRMQDFLDDCGCHPFAPVLLRRRDKFDHPHAGRNFERILLLFKFPAQDVMRQRPSQKSQMLLKFLAIKTDRGSGFVGACRNTRNLIPDDIETGRLFLFLHRFPNLSQEQFSSAPAPLSVGFIL